MNKSIWILVTMACATTAFAQSETPASSPVATARDVESLRQQVQALTETVKELQQQVKDQQAALEKANITPPALPQSSATPAVAGSPAAPALSATPPQLFPTEDSSAVASTAGAAPPLSAPSPGMNANGTALPGSFPTTDSSVVTSAPETISSTGAGSSLTQPITIGGGKNYMNISFDG